MLCQFSSKILVEFKGMVCFMLGFLNVPILRAGPWESFDYIAGPRLKFCAGTVLYEVTVPTFYMPMFTTCPD